MDILFLSHRAPSAPDRGDRIRSFHVLRHLSARARVRVVAFDEGDAARPDLPLASWTVVPRTKSRGRAVAQALARGRPVSLTAFADPAMTAALAAQPRPDAVYCFSGQMAQHVPAGQRFVMDFVDVDSAKFEQLAGTVGGHSRWLYAREARLLADYEREVAARSRANLFVSEPEAALFRARGGLGTVEAIGNGIDAASFDPAQVVPVIAPGEGPLIVFTGQMDYRPNIGAATWFVRDVLPKLPDARFAIVGRAPTAAVRALAGPRVIVTGEVADTRPWLAAAALCVAPLQLARGVQNKVLEAMAMARPVLATPAAAEGIDHGGTIRVAAADAFAETIAEMLARPGTLGAQARAQVLAHYDWDVRLAPLDRLFGFGRAVAA